MTVVGVFIYYGFSIGCNAAESLLHSQRLPGFEEVAVDGTPLLRFLLCSVAIARNETLEIALQYTIDGNTGAPRFAIPALQTGVYPSGRSNYFWRRPGGGDYLFRATADPSRYQEKSGTWYMTRVEDRIVISDGATAFTYNKGQLSRAEHRNGLTFGVSSRGSNILQLSLDRIGMSQAILAADYDEEGKCVELRIMERKLTFTYDKEGKLLQKVESNGHMVYEFTHKDGLLATVWNPDENVRAIGWVTRSRWHDSRLGSPVLVLHIGPIHYDYREGEDVVEITRVSPERVDTLWWNAFTKKIVRRSRLR